jgi:diadenosine tetraphosphate (Ap4A) HIT family hydrolase
MSTCRLCSNLVSDSSNKAWNTRLFESANFVALPSLGSLVEGWLLLVPKEHFISIGALPTALASEMELIKHEIASSVERQYGSVCVFEHGPSAANHNVGCSVDHAHLHIVPIGFDLAAAAAPFMPPDASWSNATWKSCRAAFEEGQDYLYLEQPIGNGRITVHDDFGSQVFRRAIASRLGVPEQFSWREYPAIETVARTVQHFGVILLSERNTLSGSEDAA